MSIDLALELCKAEQDAIYWRTDSKKHQAELTRLTALLEDRQAIAKVLEQAWEEWEQLKGKPRLNQFQADRLIAYLKPLG